jgi:hypothetical protein
MHLAYVAAGLTCQGMADLLRRVSDSAPSSEEVTRLQSIVGPLQNMALSDGRKFLSDTVASTKATKADKPDATVKTRASEVGAIYGALKLVPSFKVEGMGYWKALSSARAALKERGINASGAKLLSPAEKAEKATARAIDVQDVRAIMGDTALTAEDKVQRIAALEQAAAAEVAKGESSRHADRIIKANGVDYARELVAALEKAIGQAEQTPPQVGQADALAVEVEVNRQIKAKKATKAA